MTLLDGVVVGGYLAGVVALAGWLSRRQRDSRDYFLAGRRMGAFRVALSLVATQVSAISLIGAPAFIAVREGGGLRWWQYEFAVPLAMMVLMVTLVPAYHRTGAVTIYHYLERRFGPVARTVVAGVFLLSRGLSSGVILFTTGVVLAGMLGWDLSWTLLVVACITMVYTTLGGIAADIYSDILQLGVLWFSALVMIGILLMDGGLPQPDPERFRVFFPEGWGVRGGGDAYGLWPMLFGGFFLYLAYYGTDQSEAQRLLTTASVREAQRALVLNGVLRFPLVLTYSMVGILLVGFLQRHPEFAARLAEHRPDALVPLFVEAYLPEGLRGLFLAGVFAATMSSVDSAMNALSAATVEDVLKRLPGFPTLSSRMELWLSRGFTVFWGGVATLFAFYLMDSGETVIELVNRVGSAFYGPILALFFLGILSRRATQWGGVVGLLTGVGVNLYLWRAHPEISWLWWNPVGFGVGMLVGYGVSLLGPSRRIPVEAAELPVGGKEIRQGWGILAGMFGVILLICAGVQWALTR